MNQPTVVALLCVFAATARGEDWPMWGRDQTRNPVSPERGAPADWQVEWKKAGKVVQEARNIKWSAALGSVSMGGPVVANGLVWMGTNNSQPRDPEQKKDASVLMCFRERDGQFLWQYVSPRLGSGHPHDWPYSGMPAPLVEGDRLWVVTNRCETVCFDIGPLRRGEGTPKLLWKVDMFADLGVRPHAAGMASMNFCCIGASYKDWIFVVTGNGVDESYINIPAPKAPSLIALNKHSGKVVWQNNTPTLKADGLPPVKDEDAFLKSPLKRLMDRGEVLTDGQWTSPLVAEVNGRGQVVVGQGDGWLRSFDPATGKLLWECDCNPKGSKHERGGRGIRSHFVATPVLHEGRVYVGVGQAPENYAGVGHLYCVDPTRGGDVSPELVGDGGVSKPNPKSAVVWQYGGKTTAEDQKKLDRDYYFGRTVSTVAVHDGVAYAAEIDGYLHCLDSRSGKPFKVHDLKSSIVSSCLWVDGKVYVGTDDGDVWIVAHGKQQQEPRKLAMNHAIRSTPIFANNVLFLATERTLYAIQERK